MSSLKRPAVSTCEYANKYKSVEHDVTLCVHNILFRSSHWNVVCTTTPPKKKNQNQFDSMWTKTPNNVTHCIKFVLLVHIKCGSHFHSILIDGLLWRIALSERVKVSIDNGIAFSFTPFDCLSLQAVIGMFKALFLILCSWWGFLCVWLWLVLLSLLHGCRSTK